ncbi:ketopantoate reductase family protein [Spirochaeta cellobiosiphila]|uniref:ketopantoate reductase family protein n=1 Tax=Spirochaeta cellobiosiphila TaxID=504483 RepID=UPI0003F9F2BD|nr:ketopantoate reductase family protein [Spirochaeta cellobiosiphila]
MKIAVIGAGAMGSIYGGNLSKENEVYLIDNNEEIVNKINKEGLIIQKDGVDQRFTPKATTNSEALPSIDLIILFVKSLYSRDALWNNKNLIGEHTCVMTLQNGSGHEDILKEFVPLDRIIIGTTEDNGAVLGKGCVRHGGRGKTNIGMLGEDRNDILPVVKKAFDDCGFKVVIHSNIKQLIWNKLFTNSSLSAVTAILQVDIGFIADNPYAFALTKSLIKEACAVAQGMGLEAKEEDIIEEVRNTSLESPKGCTSIRADIRDGRKTEVDTISGAVVRAAEKLNIPVPNHTFVLNMIHALEQK